MIKEIINFVKKTLLKIFQSEEFKEIIKKILRDIIERIVEIIFEEKKKSA